MEGLTKEQAIKNHREFWNWIADETNRTGRCAKKTDAISHFGLEGKLVAGCWLCTYRGSACFSIFDCALDWPRGCCVYKTNNGTDGLYKKWLLATAVGDKKTAEKLAREIANLPEA